MQLDAEVTRRLKVTADRMVKRVARANAKRDGNVEPGGMDSPTPDPRTIDVADKVLILLSEMTSVRAKGKIAAAALAKRQGRRNRKYTKEEFTVSRARKQFREDTADRPQNEWKYEMEEIKDELFSASALLKITDGLVRQVGQVGRIDMNFGESGPDREASMADAMRKRAALTQEQVAEQADANDGETVPPTRSQVTTRSRGESASDALKVDVGVRKKPVRKGKGKRKKKSSPLIKVGDIFQDHDSKIEYTVTSVSGKSVRALP